MLDVDAKSSALADAAVPMAPGGLRVLVSPLDWGLGHATRIIPIVRYLVECGCQVTIAASDATKDLLAAEFPDLLFLDIPGYRVKYSQKGSQFFLKMAAQCPRILFSILREHLWLRSAMRVHRWDAVISDNRYGLFHPQVSSVILTHQVRLRTGWAWLDALLRPWLWALLRRFDVCWVPDMPGTPNLAGALCHGHMPRHVRHIGPLSRFEPEPASSSDRLLVLLSGPEPQRTLLESTLRQELSREALPAIVVQGLPGPGVSEVDTSGVEWIRHLPAAALQVQIRDAGWVVARSGYSTVMDLVCLRKAAVFIPTPGQPEQEYLARHLQQMGLFPFLPQGGFRLKEALAWAKQSRPADARFDFHRHKTIIREWLEGIRHKDGGQHV